MSYPRLALFLLSAVSVWGQNLVLNPSFEDGVITTNTSTTASALNVPNWTVSSGVVLYNGSITDTPVPINGSQAVILDSPSFPVTISQDLFTTIGQTYLLSVIWGREDAPYGFTNPTHLTIDITGTAQTDWTRGQSASPEFATETLNFVATAGTTTLTFTSLNNPEERNPILDSVSVTGSAPAVVPEPATVALWDGLAVLGLVIAVRWRRKAR